MLVVVTVYDPANAARMAEVDAALKSRPDLLVLGFVDGCCSQPENISTFMPSVNAIAPWGATTVAYQAENVVAPVNPASPYAASFPATIAGGYFSSLGGVPNAYQLYTDPARPGNAYGLFVPQAASNSGAGACLFMLADASQFGNGTQSADIAKAFATAALDPIAENQLYLKYSELTDGKLSFFISHRLSSTRFCDRILFVSGGQITEMGTHEELMAKKGAYYKMFQVQSYYYREQGVAVHA